MRVHMRTHMHMHMHLQHAPAPADLHLQVLEWHNLSVHVPPMLVPDLSSLLDEVDVEAMRAAATAVRRRLLWTSIYGSCHLAEGEGGGLDAFDTLMEARIYIYTLMEARPNPYPNPNAHGGTP